MVSPKYFSRCAAFPEDLPVADLATISLKRLDESNQDEASKLFDACRHNGFFLLDLHDSEEGSQFLARAETMFDLAEETFDLPKAVLDKFAFKSAADIIGYKEAGKLKTDDGKVDATEVYTIGQDDMIGSFLPRKNPQPIELHRNECRDFIQRAYAAVAVVLAVLDAKLGLPKGTLADLSSLGKASHTAMRLLLTRPQEPLPRRITFGGHTDIGVISLLFNVAGGLQMLPGNSDNVDENWRYVRPQQGCCLINLGDTIVEWTGGLLRSGLHRVVTAPGEQSSSARVSVGYFVRPAHGVSMRRLRAKGSVIPLPTEGDEEDTRTVDDWATERTSQIFRGVLKARSSGGVPIALK